MQITIEVKKVDGLFLKQEMGEGKVGDEPLSFGIGLPGGTPYIHLRGEYHHAPTVFEEMIRAVHDAEGCEPPEEGV